MSVRSFARPVAVAAIAMVPAIALVGPANAGGDGGCGGGAGVLTVHVSDSTPAAGQQFVVRGRLDFFGMTSADHVIKVQTKRDGSWQPIKGARVLTDDNGHYRMPLVLEQAGARRLRVVGVGTQGDPNMHTKFHVTVH
jgi:hypothetical protein